MHLSATDGGGSGVAATQYRAAGDVRLDDRRRRRVRRRRRQRPGPAHLRHPRPSTRPATPASPARAPSASTRRRPSTTATGLGADELSDWSTTARTVSLSADDGPGSGVASIHYTVDGGADQTYATAFTVSGVGQHPVTYWSVDKNGNVGGRPHRAGSTSPTPTPRPTGLAADLDSHWHNGAATVTITAHGAPGPLSVCYQLDGGALQEVASPATLRGLRRRSPHGRLLRARTATAARASPQTGYVNIDTVAPVTTTQVERAAGLGQPRRDPRVPRERRLLRRRRDLQRPRRRRRGRGRRRARCRPRPITRGDGVHTVTYWSTDAAGNVGSRGRPRSSASTPASPRRGRRTPPR